MNLEKEGLFSRHLVALFKKRAQNFRRDKKAWVCTTIIPSVVVFLGFLFAFLQKVSVQLDPLTLDLNDLNEGQVNSIPVNEPGNPFQCQPGFCFYSQAEIDERVTVIGSDQDTYSFCGKIADLGSTNDCTITESSNIATEIEDNDLKLRPVTDVNDVSVTAFYTLQSQFFPFNATGDKIVIRYAQHHRRFSVRGNLVHKRPVFRLGRVERH